jgi:tRNA-splicing ligase RtcB
MAKKIRGNHLLDIGYKPGRPVGVAIDVSKKLLKRNSVEEVLEMLKAVLDDPKAYVDHEHLGKVAETMIKDEAPKVHQLRDEPLPYEVYGADGIEKGAIDQMNTAMSLPVSRAGALMPDAHQGYGLPIGGVLAAENAIIPYAVGVDIGCRMCMTLYDMGDENYVDRNKQRLKKALGDHTRFGMREVHDNPFDHEIFERPEFKEIKIVKDLKDKAYNQIGTSGGGNHFVEFGDVEILIDNHMGVKPGKYVAVLSHSGSRGFGANIADFYTKLAMKKTPLPKHAQHLAWLNMDSEEGMEYWIAMNLALDYASACHHDIHRRLQKYLGAEPLAMIENHHNFAAKEIHDGVEYIVHRKGATPASKDEYGIIPGTMADFGYIVRGLGEPNALRSASHGAGRVMSRKQAKETFSKSYMRNYLKDQGIVLIGSGADEFPMAYKKIDEVMESQKDLVEKVGKFMPKVVRMADDEPKAWEKKKKKK